MDLAMLRNTHGIQMPLHMQLERKSVPANLRLPGMHSSNLSQEVLSGKINDLDVEDVLNSMFFICFAFLCTRNISRESTLLCVEVA
jgi:hypothetical protein